MFFGTASRDVLIYRPVDFYPLFFVLACTVLRQHAQIRVTKYVTTYIRTCMYMYTDPR